mgnify:CR=1 FL=1
MTYVGSRPSNKALTTADIADSAVTAAKIADGTVVASEIADGTITAAKIASGVVPTLRPNAQGLIINGSMAISQRGTSFAGHTSGYTIDRYECSESTDGAVTITQDSSVPTGQGFGKSMKWDVTTADSSLSATQFCNIITKLEGQDCQVFNYGTSDAKTLTLSFWCKSSKTGTYCISLVKETGGQTRYEFVKEYSISSANTWEKKIITISPTAGSTTFITNSAGAIVNSNASGLRIMFTLCTGTDYQVATNDKWYQTSGTSIATSNQVNFMDNTSNDFYLTGVQIEADSFSSSTIPPFQHESYGDNLSRCERYYQVVGSGTRADNLTYFSAYNHDGTSTMFGIFNFRKEMRSGPSIDQTSGTNYYTFKCNNAADDFDGVNGFRGGIHAGEFYLSGGSSVGSSSAGQAGKVMGKDASSHIALVSEL